MLKILSRPLCGEAENRSTPRAFKVYYNAKTGSDKERAVNMVNGG